MRAATRRHLQATRLEEILQFSAQHHQLRRLDIFLASGIRRLKIVARPDTFSTSNLQLVGCLLSKIRPI